jgi:hypothetical protein
MRYRSLDEPILEACPPLGYTVRSLGDGLELLERCYASGLAFHEDDIHMQRITEHPQWYPPYQTAPLYRPDLVSSLPMVRSLLLTIWFDDVPTTLQ